MKRLTVYRVGKKWFGHAVEDSADRKEFRQVEVPQTEPEIESFAKREGFEIEWDRPESDAR